MFGNKKNQNKADSQVEAQPKNRIKELYEWAESLVMVPVAVVLVFAFVARTSQVSGTSMLQTLHNGEMLVVSSFAYTPQQGDIVVVTQPTFSNEPLVKRVIATEGQSINIDFEKGIVYVDEQPLDEPYTNTLTTLEYDMTFPQTIKPGHIFVMGDNRNGSIDSRATSIGQIDTRKLMGRAYFRVLPFDQFTNLTER